MSDAPIALFSVATVLVCGLAFALNIPLLERRFVPALIVAATWTPALVFQFFSVKFIDPVYLPLNHGVSPATGLLMGLGFLSFTLGTVAGFALVDRLPFKPPATSVADLVERASGRLVVLFLVGFLIFIYAFRQSDLSGALLAQSSNSKDVYQDRLAFHVGPINHLLFLMDIVSVVFMKRFFEAGKFRHTLPAAVTVLCNLMTLQKSRVLFLVFSSLFLFFLSGPSARKAVFGTKFRVFLFSAASVFGAAALLVANMLRGIGLLRLTNLSSSLIEQLYIYSGAPALLNLSGTVEGWIPSDPPKDGLILIRSLLWSFVDRDTLYIGRYLNGINNGTALMYYWADFRTLGIILIPFLVGILVTLGLRLAQGLSVFGLMAGCIAFDALVMSVYTEVTFEPTTLIIAVAAMVDVLTRLTWAPRGVASAVVLQPEAAA